MQPQPVRVLIVDDSALYRKVVRDVLSDAPGVEVLGVAANGRIALRSADSLKPDLITLDLEMPEIDGLGVLRELQRRGSDVGVVVLSGHSQAGAKLTTAALELGAFDFVVKPSGADHAANAARLQRELLPKLAAFARSRRSQSPSLVAATRFPEPGDQPPRVVAIGVSTGGPAALATVLPALPGDFSLPIVIVQHMPAVFTRTLAESLNESCSLHVQEAQNGVPVEPGNVYIAPGGKQMKVVRPNSRTTLRVTDDPPENNCRPAVDYLFRSVAELYGTQSLAVVLTGMGDDGTEGCRLLKSRGARIIAQDAASCVVFGMPRSVIQAGLANVVSPLDEVATTIRQLVERPALCE